MKRNSFYFLFFAPIFFIAYALKLFSPDIKILIITVFYMYELIIVYFRDRYVGNEIILSDFFNWESRKKRIFSRLFRD
jgi:hypothetical protein